MAACKSAVEYNSCRLARTKLDNYLLSLQLRSNTSIEDMTTER